MRETSDVVNNVVNNNLCIGCGVCTAVCPTDSLTIKLNPKGTFEPHLNPDNCDDNGICLKVCPFNPFPEQHVKTEDEIIKQVSYEKEQLNKTKYFGHYSSLSVGYAKKYRENSSSGGIASWLLKKLICENKVDHVIATIGENPNNGKHFKYAILSNEEDIDLSCKTKYYPIEAGDVLRLSLEKKGKYAFIGLPCTIKAIRLAQLENPKKWAHIKYTISIFCGGLKSTFFTEYLSSKLDVPHNEINSPKYRLKNVDSTAGDYSFSCIKKGETSPRILPMKQVGDMWGTGYFKPNACDFCEDYSGELADISLGDAWIPPYSNDGKGHSLIITRTSETKKILLEGQKTEQLYLEKISERQAAMSQEGNYNHRRIGLSYRLKWAKSKNRIIPPKRRKEIVFENPLKAKIFKLRQQIQHESMLIWMEERDNLGKLFETKILKTKRKLLMYTKLEHLFRKKYWIRKIKGK